MLPVRGRTMSLHLVASAKKHLVVQPTANSIRNVSAVLGVRDVLPDDLSCMSIPVTLISDCNRPRSSPIVISMHSRCPETGEEVVHATPYESRMAHPVLRRLFESTVLGFLRTHTGTQPCSASSAPGEITLAFRKRCKQNG